MPLSRSPSDTAGSPSRPLKIGVGNVGRRLDAYSIGSWEEPVAGIVPSRVVDVATPLLSDINRHDLPALPAEAVAHGEIFTRRWVVDLILDLLGYTADKSLCDVKLVEPACGSGAFLVAVASRISASCRTHDRPLGDALAAVRALDLLDRNVQQSRSLVEKQFVDEGWQAEDARKVASAWIEQDDYLLQPDADHRADYVVGNPPYIRLEDVPDDRMAAYRSVCSTMGGRADIYIGFYEVALRSLNSGGQLGFICADRWMRNQYGRRLREMVTSRFSMDLALVMHDVDAFEDPNSPPTCADTGPWKPNTTSATAPSPKTPPPSTPATHLAPWPPSATSRSEPSKPSEPPTSRKPPAPSATNPNEPSPSWASPTSPTSTELDQALVVGVGKAAFSCRRTGDLRGVRLVDRDHLGTMEGPDLARHNGHRSMLATGAAGGQRVFTSE
jgi:Eco57I restriction-modification methylase